MRQLRKRVIGLAVGLAIILVAGCATTTTEYVTTPLQIPDRPTLPTVVAGDLQCLGNQTYEDMVARDAMLQAHIKRLEAIILTTESDRGEIR